MSRAKPAPATTRRCGGIFQPDPDVPADPLSGDVFCTCGLAGAQGDTHHPTPDVPAQAEVRHRYGDDE